eukprot:m.265161 g.265161  ORF g.265161 m.265161 type:complete len:311 (-) comp29322_c0_seq1:211-1143(-)
MPGSVADCGAHHAAISREAGLGCHGVAGPCTVSCGCDSDSVARLTRHVRRSPIFFSSDARGGARRRHTSTKTFADRAGRRLHHPVLFEDSRASCSKARPDSSSHTCKGSRHVHVAQDGKLVRAVGRQGKRIGARTATPKVRGARIAGVDHDLTRGQPGRTHVLADIHDCCHGKRGAHGGHAGKCIRRPQPRTREGRARRMCVLLDAGKKGRQRWSLGRRELNRHTDARDRVCMRKLAQGRHERRQHVHVVVPVDEGGRGANSSSKRVRLRIHLPRHVCAAHVTGQARIHKAFLAEEQPVRAHKGRDLIGR